MKKRMLAWLLAFLAVGILSLIFDNSIASYMASVQNSYLDTFFSILESYWAIALITIFMIFLLVKKHKNKAIGMFILTLAASTIVSFVLKFIIMRPRPLGLVEFLPFINLIDYSFPSSHAVFMFSVLPIMNREFPRMKYLFLALACLIAFSRIYFNVHYASDVILGAVIGYVIGYYLMKRI